MLECERKPTPAARLKALAYAWVEMREPLVSYGCPVGGLNAELGKKVDGSGHEAAVVLRLLVDWAEVQFRQISKKDAADHAVQLIGGPQGAALLTNARRDPSVNTRQVRRLD